MFWKSDLSFPSFEKKQKTKEGAVTAKGAAITIWHLKPLTNHIVPTMGTAITLWRFIANDQSNRLPIFW